MKDTVRFEVTIPNAADVVQRYREKQPSRRCGQWYGGVRIAGPWKQYYARVKPIYGERGAALLVETSPKFLFGHNVCGSSDVKSQVWSVVEHVGDALGLGDELCHRFDDIELHRIDLVANLALDRGIAIKDAIRSLYWYFHAVGKSLATYERFGKYGTLYVNPKSKRRLTFYDKDQQLAVARAGMARDVPEYDCIRAWATTVLRFEARWNRSALGADPRQLHRLANWDCQLARNLVNERLESLSVKGSGVIPAELADVGNLTPVQRALVRLHASGADLLAAFDDRRALTRLREKVQKATGVDVFGEPGARKAMSIKRLINDPSVRVYGRPRWLSAPYRAIRHHFRRAQA